MFKVGNISVKWLQKSISVRPKTQLQSVTKPDTGKEKSFKNKLISFNVPFFVSLKLILRV